MTDLGQAARENLARLQAALRALWPDRPVVYFTDTADHSLGPGPALTEEERRQLARVAEAIREGEDRGVVNRAEVIRAVREEAWAHGYDACRRGKQRHNPYRAASGDAS